ncbi:hypothetical protein [Desulfosporosinus acidiphilus]|nr:hypothetical protein [Desulfosporosinus acidiphilus]
MKLIITLKLIRDTLAEWIGRVYMKLNMCDTLHGTLSGLREGTSCAKG